MQEFYDKFYDLAIYGRSEYSTCAGGELTVILTMSNGGFVLLSSRCGDVGISAQILPAQNAGHDMLHDMPTLFSDAGLSNTERITVVSLQ